MRKTLDLQAAVRRELSLDEPSRRIRRSPLLGLSITTALLGILGAGSASAQAPYQQQVIPGFSSLKVEAMGRPTLVDLDEDGDVDAVVGEYSGSVRFFKNTGSSSAPAFVEESGHASPFDGLDVGTYGDPNLMDLDGDGDFDAVVGAGDGSLRFLENSGSSSSPDFLERTGSSNPFVGIDVGSRASPILEDLDGDGDSDAVVGEFSGSLRYFENTGSSSEPAFAQRTGIANPFDGIALGFHGSPELADVDGDGDPDAVFGVGYGALRYFENTGSSSGPSFVEVTGSTSPFAVVGVGRNTSPALVDLDEDGDLDAVVGERYGNLRSFTNTGSSSAPDFVEATGSASPFVGIDVGYSSTPELVDLDGDGDLDAVVGEEYGSLRFFQNTGSWSVPSFEEGTGSANPFAGIDVGLRSSPVLVDLDGDGDLDAVVGESQGSLRYFENTASSSAPTFVEQTGSANPFAGIDVGNDSNPELVDLDGDGDLDAVVGGSPGLLGYFKNTGSSSAPTFVEATGSANPLFNFGVVGVSSPELVDLDGDGDLDALVGSYPGSLIYFRNTGSPSAPGFFFETGSANPLASFDVGRFSSPALVDLDGDGDLDAFLGEFTGKVVFLRSRAETNVFADGFESGDTSAWSLTVPGS